MGAKSQPTFENMMIKDSSFRIVPASLGDLQQLGEMEKICFPQDAWPLLEQIAALILPGMVRFKAISGDKMIGFAAGDVRHSQGLGWITTLGVLPAYRRIGIAQALLEKCEQEMGMPHVRLTVRRTNIEAQALYFKNGYQQLDVWREYYDGGEDALVLEKILPEFRNVGLL